MRWAVAFHPDQIQALPDGRKRLLVAPMQIAEHCLPAARGQGWVVLGMDTGLYDDRILKALAPVDVPLQSNPRRYED